MYMQLFSSYMHNTHIYGSTLCSNGYRQGSRCSSVCLCGGYYVCVLKYHLKKIAITVRTILVYNSVFIIYICFKVSIGYYQYAMFVER